MRAIEIGGKPVGDGHPCFVIAEAGVNHNGDMAIARDLVKLAARSGADAIKFQTFDAERITTATAPKAAYQRTGTDTDESQQAMLKRLELGPREHRQLMDVCKRERITFLSSPFDEQSADLLDELGVEAFKVPSGEITNLPFLRHLAKKKKPLIVSTGMSTLAEVATAVNAIKQAANVPVVLLHCVSLYPSPAKGTNLRAMQAMRERFRVPVGYSDHTQGIDVALAAVALGASMLEKHFTTSRSLPGPDHAASLEPNELEHLVKAIREVESALGDGVKKPLPEEAETAAVARKSVVAKKAIAAGAVIAKDMLAVMRPGTGLPPAKLEWIVGRKARKPIPGGTVITQDMV